VKNGALFDVPEDVAEELLKLPENSEIVIHVLKNGKNSGQLPTFLFVSESGLICPLTRRVMARGMARMLSVICVGMEV
jgi:hypothetical protein